MTALGVVIGRGLLSARPAAGITGSLYYATDNNSWYRDNGTTWDTQNAAASSLLTTKGDLLTHSTVDARLAVGSDGQVLTADSAQTLGIKWATASAAGLLLAVHTYAAGSDASVTTTSTSFVDVDATNQAITFTAPASGNVVVRVTGQFVANNATNNIFFDLRESTTDLSGTSRVAAASNANWQSQIALAFSLSGIAAGSHTYKLGFRTANAGTQAQVWTGPTYGQTLYEVWAAP